jgi:dihydrodipicolinate reductase
MPTTDSITVHKDHVETDAHLYRAVIIHTDDLSEREVPLDKESIRNTSQSSERVRKSVQQMTGNADVDVDVYQPGEFESPIHECLQRQAYLLVVLSTSGENETTTTDAKVSLETAMDNLRYTWSQRFSEGFEMMLLKYKQDHILPLLDETPNGYKR